MHDLQTRLTRLAEANDLIVGQRRVPAIDVPNHIGSGFQHHVRIDQTGAGDRRSTRVNGRLHPVFACPIHHLLGGRSVFHSAKTNFAEQLDPGISHFLEVMLLQALLDHWRTRMDFDARGAEVVIPTLRRNRERLENDNIFGPSVQMNPTRRNHRRNPAVEGGVNPTELLLARRVIPDNRMNVTVDQTRREREAFRVNDRLRAGEIHIRRLANRGDLAINGNDAIRI